MSYDYDDQYDDDQNQNGPKALRDQLEKLKKQLADKDKELTSLREENTTLTGKVKTSTLRDVLAESGIDPKHARLAERDGVEATPESVAKWREDYADVYAFFAAKAQEQVEQNDDQEQQAQVADNVPPELAALLASAQGLESQGQPVGSSDLTDALESVDVSKVESPEALLAMLRAAGAPLQ